MNIENKLSQLENELSTLVRDFRRIGEILKTIRDERLYRDGYSSFEDYCSKRWHFTRQRADQFISAYRLDDELGGCLENESQARTLLGLPDSESRQKVSAEAKALVCRTGKPYGAVLKACAANHALCISNKAPAKQKDEKVLKKLQALFVELNADAAWAFHVWTLDYLKETGVYAPSATAVVIDVGIANEIDADNAAGVIFGEATHE